MKLGRQSTKEAATFVTKIPKAQDILLTSPTEKNPSPLKKEEKFAKLLVNPAKSVTRSAKKSNGS